MPIGGSNIAWDNTTPADTESAGLGDDRIRSMKTSVQQALDNEHNFPAGGGADTGYHRIGSARAYFGLDSQVSATTDGRLMITSDTSRLFGVGSEGTCFIGGQNVISAVSRPIGGQRFYWAQEFGVAQVGAGSGAAIVSFSGAGYNGVPFVSVSLISEGFAGGGLSVWLDSLNNTGFTVKARASSTTGLVTNASITSLFWFSIGTRTL